MRLGDKMNGFLAEENVASVADIVPWLQEAIAHFYPESTYALSLDPEIRERAAKRIFLPPRTGARVICPYCGVPNASQVIDDSLIFTCGLCGNALKVPRPKVQ